MANCTQCGAAESTRHPILGPLCWWHTRLVETFHRHTEV